jgi:peptidoglycan DL-endopeptidase CwlO
MITHTLSRGGAIAVACVASFALVTGCTNPVTVGVSPGTILSTVSAVIANLPASTTTPERRGGSSGSTRSRGARIPASPPPSAAAIGILRTADACRGVPYVWGGNTPNGFDCSGFTKFVFAKHGIALPRTSREQSRVGRAVSADFRALRPGDLMFFAERGEAISHVAIYAGNGEIIHSSSSNGGVGYTDLNSGGDWFVINFVAARRVD